MTGFGTLFLISEKLKKVLEKIELTGWRTYDVKILGKKGNEIPGYYGFSVTGRAGKIDYSLSEKLEKRLIEDGPLTTYYKGIYFDINTWDGSDFFLLHEHYGTVITEKVAKILKASKLTNIKLERLQDAETLEIGIKNKI